MKMRIKTIVLQDFKGIRSATYNLDSERASISGKNGTGKTTIATAFMWLLFDRDYELNSNPNILPLGVEECEPSVEVIADIDGVEVSVKKIQKVKRSKPDENGIQKVSLNNTYEVNAVPYGERDFKAKLSGYGFDFENALVCIHPDVFTGQKAVEMRKVLFKMASEKTDKDIAGMSEETAAVAKLLESYTMDEISAMQNVSKKKATEQCDSIPSQIIGLEKAKVVVDVPALDKKRAELTGKIVDCDMKIHVSGKELDDLKQQKMDLLFSVNDCRRKANESLNAAKHSLQAKLYNAKSQVDSCRRMISAAESEISSIHAEQARLKSKKVALGDSYRSSKEKVFTGTVNFHESKWVFDESDTVCAMCGQTLPEDRILSLRSSFEEKKAAAKEKAEKEYEEALARFNARKKEEMDSCLSEGNACIEREKQLLKELKKLEAQVSKLLAESGDYAKTVKCIESELSGLPTEADLSGNEEYTGLAKKLAEIESQIATATEQGVDVSAIEEEKRNLTSDLESVKQQIALGLNNVRIDEQIAELREQQRNYEQAKADAERIIFQLNLVSKKKNSMLVEEINSHFTKVKWDLWESLKNGEYREICVPRIDGYRFGESANTGRELIAKLDICNSLSRFFGTSYPVLLDGAESLNQENIPDMDCQLITLSVTDTDFRIEVD